MYRRRIKLLFLAAVLAIPFSFGSVRRPRFHRPLRKPRSPLFNRPSPDAGQPATNAWMLVSAALGFVMTGPGLALFYGGLVRRRTSSPP